MRIRTPLRIVLPAVFFLLAGGNCRVALAQTRVQDEIEQLKKQVAAQQREIDELRRLLGAQAKPEEKAVSVTPARATAGATAGAPVTPAPATAPTAAPPERRVETAEKTAPLKIGGVAISPTGFIDFSQVWRSKTVSSGLPTNFAAIPFKNTVQGERRQTLSSAANSRLGMQVSTKFSGIGLLGVVETDFLGYQPGNIATSANSYGLRLRLAFADLHIGKWEFLGGQAWSLLTPGRRGIPALSGGLMLTQDLNPNIHSGLVWARVPQVRAVYRPKRDVALAVSFESGSAYVGGSGGAGPITLPSALAPNYFNQVDTGSGALGVPNPYSDLIAKVAFDPEVSGHALHIEAAGLMNHFSFFNPLDSKRFGTTGGGVALSAGIDVTRKLTLLTSNFYSKGGGRYIFGEAPAMIILGNGAPSLLKSMSTLEGVEYQARPSLKLWAYYGGTYIDRNVSIDPSNGDLIGYGYQGSPDSQNRSIQEVSGGFIRFLWKDPGHGALQFSGQYSWLVRHPWWVATGQPASANLNMVYLGLRYSLPTPPSPPK